MPDFALTACHECDLLQREPPLPSGGIASCPRCHAVLFRHTPDMVNRGLAYTLGAVILFIVANAYPIVGLEVQGTLNQTSLYGAVQTIWDNDMVGVAMLVFVTTILIPALELSLQAMRPWSMTQVFILGVLVSLVKLAHLAHVVPGLALWSFGGLILLLTAAVCTFNPHELWDLVGESK